MAVSYSLAGLLTALPLLMLGAAAIPGALLVNRLGYRPVVGIGLAAIASGTVVRLLPSTFWLVSGTAILAASSAIAQVGLIVMIRLSFSDGISKAVALNTALFFAGGLAGASLTGLALPVIGWRGTFVFWAIPAVAAAAVWFWFAPRVGAVVPTTRPNVRVVLSSPYLWRMTALFGSCTLAYYASSAWIPFVLHDAGTGYTALILLILNVVQLGPPLLLSLVVGSWATSRIFYVVAGLDCVVGATGFALGITGAAWGFAILLGIGSCVPFLGAMALPALVARSDDEAANLTAVMLAVGYCLAFAGPLLAGLLVDATGNLGMPFWLVAAFGGLIVGVGLTLPRPRSSEPQSTAELA
jgi:CP family cyanate transporter-like MFS transporter